jgi:hypothetical protein
VGRKNVGLVNAERPFAIAPPRTFGSAHRRWLNATRSNSRASEKVPGQTILPGGNCKQITFHPDSRTPAAHWPRSAVPQPPAPFSSRVNYPRQCRSGLGQNGPCIVSPPSFPVMARRAIPAPFAQPDARTPCRLFTKLFMWRNGAKRNERAFFLARPWIIAMDSSTFPPVIRWRKPRFGISPVSETYCWSVLKQIGWRQS